MKLSRLLMLLVLCMLLFSAKRYKPPVFDLKYIEDNMAYIPACSFNLYAGDDDLPYDSAKNKTVSVDAFYMSRFEMTNGCYLWYLHQLQLSDTAAYRKALPDTLVWKDKPVYEEPYVIYYLRHPAYANYPLVGVSYAQAKACCEWLTKQYNSMPGRKFASVTFDLPTKNQWMSAAKCGNAFCLFPWGNDHMRNASGQVMANFLPIDEASIHRKNLPRVNAHGDTIIDTYYVGWRGGDEMDDPGKLNDAADITAPVNSYWPNKYGLYNLSGNVEEMVNEKGISKGGSWYDPGYYLRIGSEENYSDNDPVSSERGFRVMMKVNGDSSGK